MNESIISQNEGYIFSTEKNVSISITPDIPNKYILQSDIILIPGSNIINAKSFNPSDKSITIDLGYKKRVVSKKDINVRFSQLYILKVSSHTSSNDFPIIVYNDVNFKLERNGIYLLQPSSHIVNSGIKGFNRSFLKVEDFNSFSPDNIINSEFKGIVGPLFEDQRYAVKAKDGRYVLLTIGGIYSSNTIYIFWEYFN